MLISAPRIRTSDIRALSVAFGLIALTTGLLLTGGLAFAQELEPRRWSHLPIGTNFVGAGYIHTRADVLFLPAIQVENAKSEVNAVAMSYIRVLDVFGKSGRIDVLLPYAVGRWEGLLEGQPASTRRSGFADPKLRFSVNLLGSPSQRGEDFKVREVNTIVGAALQISLPLGDYQNDKLINLGKNRWSIRPQLGIVHKRHRWEFEVSTSAWFFTENDDFFDSGSREQDPVYAIQGHVIYTFRPGLWASLSTAYGDGAQSTINDVQLNDKVANWLWGASVGLPISPKQGIKITYLRGDTRRDVGQDVDRFILGYSMMWGG